MCNGGALGGGLKIKWGDNVEIDYLYIDRGPAKGTRWGPGETPGSPAFWGTLEVSSGRKEFV